MYLEENIKSNLIDKQLKIIKNEKERLSAEKHKYNFDAST